MLNERARFRLHHPIRRAQMLHEAPTTVPQLDLAWRLIAAHRPDDNAPAAGAVWDVLVDDKQKPLARALAEKDAETLAAILAALGRSPVAEGFFGGERQHRKFADDPAFAEMLALWTYDKLVSLAEAVGALRIELPENGGWAQNVDIPPETLFFRIEQHLGIDLSPPDQIGGYLGLRVGSRTLQMRAIEAIYTAYRLKQIADAHGFARVCEIGAGAGLTAYYAHLFGISDYTIIDLPTMNAVQAYVLGGSRIGGAVRLHGEDKGGTLRILPHTAFAELPAGSVEILYNQDSLPEIEPRAARAYLRDAHRLSIPLLLSINQEAHLPAGDTHQESVPELIAETGGYRLLSRHRHWLRQGYAEELYARHKSI